MKTAPINFKANVYVIHSQTTGNQPERDKVLLEREAQRVKADLEAALPSRDDNVQIFIQPYGFRSRIDSREYYNGLTAYLGYENREKARQDMINRSINPPNEDYVALSDETVTKLKNRSGDIMEKLRKQVDVKAECVQGKYIENSLRQPFVNDIVAIVKNALDYGLTEYVKPEQEIIIPDNDDKTRYWV